LKFFMSIFFPLVIALVFWQWARKDQALILAWLGFLMGALQYFLLIEKGSRFTHANFLWGAQITLFMLFVVSIRFLLKHEAVLKQSLQWSSWVPYAVYLPHILSGIAYYIFCYVTPHYG
jgi:hypothetical protein